MIENGNYVSIRGNEMIVVGQEKEVGITVTFQHGRGTGMNNSIEETVSRVFVGSSAEDGRLVIAA